MVSPSLRDRTTAFGGCIYSASRAHYNQSCWAIVTTPPLIAHLAHYIGAGIMSLPDKTHMDDTTLVVLESHVSVESRDYAGAKKKNDPEEIRLVQKLDRRVMVSP
jgi:hypothetical protein